jgi:DNA-binding transcriptional regulator YiaG
LAFSPTAMQRARAARGLSQSELAAILGCPVRTIRSWEQGERVPSDENQLLIARRLRIDLIDLYAAAEPVPAA